MTEQEEKHKKVPVTTYNLGEGDYFMISPTIKGYHCWGYVANEHIEVEDKYLKIIEEKISKSLTDANRDSLIKASRFEEIALRIKENGLEKTTKDLGGKIKERK